MGFFLVVYFSFVFIESEVSPVLRCTLLHLDYEVTKGRPLRSHIWGSRDRTWLKKEKGFPSTDEDCP